MRQCFRLASLKLNIMKFPRWKNVSYLIFKIMSCKQHLYALHFVVILILNIHSFLIILLMIYVCELPICLKFSTVTVLQKWQISTTICLSFNVVIFKTKKPLRQFICPQFNLQINNKTPQTSKCWLLHFFLSVMHTYNTFLHTLRTLRIMEDVASVRTS